MKILHAVEFYHPSVGGAQEVVKQISERLVERGHDVTVATTALPNRTTSTINGVRIQGFPISGNAVRGFRGPTESYQKFLAAERFDVMMNYAAQQWSADLAFPLLPQLSYPAVFATCGFSGLVSPAYARYFRQMPEILRRYRQIILHSDSYRDSSFARQHGINHCTVIPNGASEKEFRGIDDTFRVRYGIPSDTPLLVTVGSHTGQKGHRLVIESFRQARIGPAVLLIIGNRVGRLGGCRGDCRRRALRCNVLSFGRKRVVVLDPPRADVVGALQAADLFVFGSNIECSPIVLFESMAARTAFATISCGNAQEIVDWSHGGVLVPSQAQPNGLVTTTIETMARHIEDLVHDRRRLRSLADAGYQAWCERFTWDVVSRQYEDLYRRIVA